MSEPELSLGEFNRISRYCAEEVRRQYAHVWEQDVPLRVAGMITAWLDALQTQFNGEDITPEHILRWGASIEPRNSKGFRTVPIYVGYEEKDKWQIVPQRIARLCEAIREGHWSALDTYKEFEEIHPFEDGNGRTGKIILNWVNGTLLDPIFPPNNFWGRDIINP